MDEMIFVLTASIAGMSAVLIATIYSYAGRDKTPKALRRFLCPTIMLAAIIGVKAIEHTMNFKSVLVWTLVALPPILFMIAYCMGYGADNPVVRLKKRALISLVYILGIVPICYLANSYLYLIPHILLCASTIMFAVINPFKAAKEEFYIGLVTSICLLLAV